MLKPRPLFFPEIELQRNKRTTTGQLLYSANISERYGKNCYQQLYVQTWELPYRPSSLKMMVYADQEPEASEVNRVYELKLDRIFPGNKCRYKQKVQYGDPAGIGTVYLPIKMVKKDPPETCYLEITY